MAEFKVSPMHPDYDMITDMNNFFCKQSWHLGGHIPEGVLHTAQHHNLVRNLRNKMCDAIDIAYRSLARAKDQERWCPSEKQADIRLAIRVITLCCKLKIAQDHISGILLLYLKLCENVDLL